MTSPPGSAYTGKQMPEEMRNSIRFKQSRNISLMSMLSLKWCWCSAAHFGHGRSKCSAISSPLPQCGQMGDIIRPVTA